MQSDLLLSDFHKLIQTTMGWTNSHLHQFKKDGKFYAIKESDADFWEEMNIVDYTGMTISDLLKQENDDLIFEYDFGDSWEHEIVLERILRAEENKFYPVCIGGRMNCPPEDSGGIPGYLEMLKILKQPDHEEYDQYMSWLGGEFDPGYFNIDFVNGLLQKKNFGLPQPSELEPNQNSLVDFEGYSPLDMDFILYQTFEDNSPVKLQELAESEYCNIPIFNQVKYIANLLADHKELKLTNKGFLPVKIVADIYKQGFMKDEHIESGITKLYKETDSNTIHLPRILLEISGLTKKRNNKLSLTKKGKNIIKDDFKLFSLIFQIFTTRFNWAYFDGYGENKIAQPGFGFTLILLSKYGHEKQTDRFYSDKYFRAFPKLLEGVNPSYGSRERNAANCYSIRTFNRFLDFFGLIKIEQVKGLDKPKFITKTDLFDKLIKISPPGEV